MQLTDYEWRTIKNLDDGSLYAAPEVVAEQFRYPGMYRSRLLISRDPLGLPSGYLPVGQFYDDGTLSYIAAMPNSPAISPTYPPGAGKVLERITTAYLDTDVITDLTLCRQEPTASAYCLPLDDYMRHLSPARRKDIGRKLKACSHYRTRPGTLRDVQNAWEWMQAIWETRGTAFGSTPYEEYLQTNLDWLNVLQHSGRATLKIEVFIDGQQTVGVNCCVLHTYRGRGHCDDYLTWYDPVRTNGFGIASAVRNLTHPDLQGYRYNMGNPGVGGTHPRHQYKYAILPPALRLTQGVMVCHHS